MNLFETEKKVIESPAPDWIWPSNWQKNKDEWNSSDANFIHIEKQTHVFHKTRFFRAVHRFDTLGSVQKGSQIELDFDPSFQRILIHSFTIFRETKEINKLHGLKKKLFQREVESYSYIFTGIWTLILILDDIREGDVLEYSYSYEGFNPLHDDHYIDNFYFSARIPVTRRFSRLVAPKERTFFKYHQCSFEPKENTLSEELNEWIWDYQDAKSALVETYQPSWHDAYSWIECSTFKDWESVAKWAERLFIMPIECSSEIKEQIAKWKLEHFKQEDLIIAIMRFVQNDVRYLSISEDISDSKAAEPNQVFSRRYGDCKDKSLLLKFLLNFVEIEANVVLVNTICKHMIERRLPSPHAFNHAIVCFEYNGKTYWLDPTCSGQGGNLSNLSVPFYVYGLVIHKNGKSLEEIKCSERKNKTITRTVFDLTSKNGSAYMSVETYFYHEDADVFRQYYTQISLNELNKRYLEYYNRYYAHVSATKDITIEDNLNDNDLLVKENYYIEELGKKDSERCCFIYKLGALSLMNALIIDIDLTRKTPLALSFPIDVIDEICIKLPHSIDVEEINIAISNEYIEYKEHLVKKDDLTYLFVFSLKTLKDHIDPKDFVEMREFMNKTFDRIGIVLSLSFEEEKKEIGWNSFQEKKKQKSSFWKGVGIVWFIITVLRFLTTKA